LHKSFFPELARDGPEHASADGFVVRFDQNGSVLVKPYIGPIPPPGFLAGADYNGPYNLALLYGAIRRRLFHRGGEYNSQARPRPSVAAHGQDHRNAFGS